MLIVLVISVVSAAIIHDKPLGSRE